MHTKVYLLTDERMALHMPPSSDDIVNENDLNDENNEKTEAPYEKPSRISAIYNKLLDLEDCLLKENYPWNIITPEDTINKNGNNHVANRRFVQLQCIPADRKTIELVHSAEHYDKMKNTSFMSEEELRNLAVPNELYFNQHTFLAAKLAAGGVVECVNAVTDCNTKVTRAIALVRPPGHHACENEAMGFCYFNNVAVAAKHALHTNRAKKVFILDWDIHHGNGTQDLTYDDPNIFYLSIHRKSTNKNKKNWFYPGTGNHTEIGNDMSVGSNLNIEWNRGGMGNTEYATAFNDLILPVLSSFQPDLIFVACGLDAAKGDLLGDCGLSPDLYYAMTNSLLATAGLKIPIVVALEGGYNLEVNAKCMEAVALALLDEPWKEDETDYDNITFWSSSSILPQRKKDVLNHVNPFTLSRYLSRYGINTSSRRTRLPPSTRHAFASIRRSRKCFLCNTKNDCPYLEDSHTSAICGEKCDRSHILRGYSFPPKKRHKIYNEVKFICSA